MHKKRHSRTGMIMSPATNITIARAFGSFIGSAARFPLLVRSQFPGVRSSISAFFSSGHPSTSKESVQETDIEDIRSSMLALIGDLEDKRFPHVRRRIRYATEVMSLWYLRGDLMTVLASTQGEAQARRILKTTTDTFEHLLPQGLKSRSDPLACQLRVSDRSAERSGDSQPQT